MTAPKRKCCELAEEVIKNAPRNPQIATALVPMFYAAAHLRYCAANDKTEEGK